MSAVGPRCARSGSGANGAGHAFRCPRDGRGGPAARLNVRGSSWTAAPPRPNWAGAGDASRSGPGEIATHAEGHPEWLDSRHPRIESGVSRAAVTPAPPTLLSVVIPGATKPAASRRRSSISTSNCSARRCRTRSSSSMMAPPTTRGQCSSAPNAVPELRPRFNHRSHGFGRAVVDGLDHMQGDATVIMMADESDDCRDVVRYWQELGEGWECVFGSRFMHGGGVVDYPRIKLVVNRPSNWVMKALFRIPFNDTTNAFKAYRRMVIEGCRPLISPHFNLTVELPFKAIVRGYSWKLRSRSRATVAPGWQNSSCGRWAAGICSSALRLA